MRLRNEPTHSQTSLIERVEWKNLIILDACRYDFFKEEISDFFKGSLLKAISPSSQTATWVWESFQKENVFDDVVYLSGNPFINSLNIKKQMKDLIFPFQHIEDVWDWGWSTKYNTVPPNRIIEGYRKILEEYQDKRYILHFMQPHAPYIVEEKESDFLTKLQNWAINLLGRKLYIQIRDSPVVHFIFKNIRNRFHKQMPEQIAEKEDVTILRDLYRSNLRLVLKELYKVYELLEGKTVITGDHGELLGENGFYGHPTGLRVPELKYVPWFLMTGKVSR